VASLIVVSAEPGRFERPARGQAVGQLVELVSVHARELRVRQEVEGASMLADAESGYLPVALIDDDPAAPARRICGVAVRGTRADVARATRAEILAVAVRNIGIDIDIDIMREVSRNATQAGLRVQVVPALIDLFRPWIGFSDLRDLGIADLIGRRPVDVDSPPSPGTSPTRRCWSPGPAAPSDPSCAGRSSGTAQRICSCWTATSRPCTRCSCRSPVGRCWIRPRSSSLTSAMR
jgi:hypothetical protein